MRWHILPVLIVAGVVCAPAGAQELAREAVPAKWIEEYLPEKLPELRYPAYFSDLDKAKAQVFAGRYKLGLVTLKKVTKGDAVEIALTKATALAAVGKRDKAIAVLSDAAVRDNAKVQVLRARVLGEMGRWNEGIAILKALVQKDTESLQARYYLGALAEQASDLETAKREYEWIYKKYYEQWMGQGARAFDNAEEVTLMGRAFDRYATLNSFYAKNASLHNLMLKVFVQAYDVIDRNYWPAHVAAAEYILRHGNPKEAANEINAALAGNPSDIACYAMAAQIALEQWSFDGAENAIAAMRKVDPTCIEADVMEARNLLLQRRPRDAEVPIRRAMEKQPKNIEAMSLMASAAALQLQEDKVAALIRQVEAIDPNNATIYLELGAQLGAMRQYPRSEKMYQVAIDRAPWMSEARNGLGLLLTQSGDEEKAKAVLDAAYAMDPFNYRTTNYLILLDKMAKLSHKESAHFVLFYDEKTDPLIAEYFSDYLEGMYRDVCRIYGHEPAVKTYIEVFPAHDQFSARITGAPWIGTVGASTGRVIALCTPRPGEHTLGTYNWAQVLRHEYTHTVTLSATDNRIAHWFTEGLAVTEEHSPLRWEWVPMLYNAVKNKELFSMEELTWAFVRPRKPQDRSLAYAQSYWVCTYIEEKWGHEKILKMMEAFKQGHVEEDVFRDVLGVGTEQFSKEFFAWTEKQVAGWGYDEATIAKYNDLVKKAEATIKAKKYAEAVKAWEEIVKLRPMDALPHQRLAGLYLLSDPAVHDTQKALEHLTRLDQVALKDNRFAKRIARLYLDSNELPKARQFAMESVYIDPYDLPAHEILAQVCEKMNDQPAADREKRVIPVLDKWIKDFRKSQLLEGAPSAD